MVSLGLTLSCLAACGGDGTISSTLPPPPPGPTAANVSIDQPNGFTGKIKLDVHEQFGLTATVHDSTGAVLAGHPVVWTSNAPNVATVSNTGTVTAMAVGDATISATSDGKSDSRPVQVVALNLTAFQLAVVTTNDSGSPVPGATVQQIYYGARPAGCVTCNIPYGGFVLGATNSAGSFVGGFTADPEAMDGFVGANHAYAYVITHSPNYETDRQFVIGTATSFTQAAHLHTMKQIAAGDSLSVTISPGDPVYQELDTAPALIPNTLCRSFRVVAGSDGTLTVNAVGDGGVAPFLELDKPDESELLTYGNGTVTKAVHAGEIVEVRVVWTIRIGAGAQAFEVATRISGTFGASPAISPEEAPMAKSQRKQSRTTKSKAKNGRSTQDRDRDQSEFREPTDQFVTDAEIEARERQRQPSPNAGRAGGSGSRKKGH